MRKPLLESKRYSTIVADPTWPEYGGGKIRRGANKHYSLISLDEIKSLEDQVKAWRSPSGCHLYLWVTNNYLPAGLEVMAAWGFAYKTIISWAKTASCSLWLCSVCLKYAHQSMPL